MKPSQSRHTPMPWKLKEGTGEIYSPDNDIIADVYDNPGEEQAHANCVLIEAAPEMYVALWALLAAWQDAPMDAGRRTDRMNAMKNAQRLIARIEEAQ